MTNPNFDPQAGTESPTLVDYVRAAAQYVYPKDLLSALMFRITRIRSRAFKDRLIAWFIHQFGVDMSIATEPDASAYPDFNSFFTRTLRADARPLASGPRGILCPVDGAISQIGDIEDGRIIQAKGRDFTVERLLGGDPAQSLAFAGGKFVTIYLSPKDYHRIHMPVKGRLTQMIYVPGALFSVSPSTTRVVPELFARNERVVSIFDTPLGALALVLVGAVCVGSIETVWAGAITPAKVRKRKVTTYGPTDPAIALERGEEMGRFNMGSTVIVLFPADRVVWDRSLRADQPVRMGQSLGTGITATI